MAKTLLFICLFTALLSCKKQVSNQTDVYSNDFETSDLKNIKYGTIDVFNGSKVLGRYNKGSFQLELDNLPKHDLVNISFDLYIHDTWDGSQSYADNLTGPDIWQMIVDDKTYIYTTFSNTSCIPGNICPSQAYPGTYPSNNNPRTSSIGNFPGACQNANDPNGTSLYKISRVIEHTDSKLILTCLDHLIDKNVADPKCSESWSVDNIKISTVAL